MYLIAASLAATHYIPIATAWHSHPKTWWPKKSPDIVKCHWGIKLLLLKKNLEIIPSKSTVVWTKVWEELQVYSYVTYISLKYPSVFSTNRAEKTRYSHVKEWSWTFTLHYTKEKKEKNQLKVNQNLNIRAMIAKLLEENTRECVMPLDLATFS